MYYIQTNRLDNVTYLTYSLAGTGAGYMIVLGIVSAPFRIHKKFTKNSANLLFLHPTGPKRQLLLSRSCTHNKKHYFTA